MRVIPADPGRRRGGLAVLIAHPALQVATPGQVQAETDGWAAKAVAEPPVPEDPPVPENLLPEQAPDGVEMAPQHDRGLTP